MNDAAEESFWRFDARRKGYGPWKETPQSERDAFKAEVAALRAELEQAKKELEGVRRYAKNTIPELEATIARQREWIEKTGHRPACYARECEVCGYTQGPHEWGVIRMGHKFQPGPCTCGWADLVGG